MTIDEMIAVLQAAKAGKKIQVRTHSGMAWQNIEEFPLWNFHLQDYRVKPEPREWVAEVLESGHLCTTFTGHAICGGSLIKVREVL